MRNRIIRFRIWDRQNEEMINWYELINNDKSLLLQVIESDLAEVMQFTGLTDKNGKDIYEGDIMFTGSHNRIIEWHESIAAFCSIASDKYFGFDGAEWHKWTIIGNIFENTDILLPSGKRSA